MSRRARLTAAAVACAALLVGACSVRGSGQDPAATSRPAADESPGSSASATPVIPPDGRPLLPVPSVTPYGYKDPPPGEGLNRYQSQRLDWIACLDGLECTDVVAPLDYADPNGQAITLSMVRRKATANPRLGTLFLNPGGPGASGRDLVAGFDATGLERYDLLGWDPRGTDDSTPVQCFSRGEDFDRYIASDASPDNNEELGIQISQDRSFGQACLHHSGSLLKHVSTAETVRDLDLLRGLVGDNKLNYLGFSYGTLIGSLYAHMYPKRVGRVVLDGAVNITDSPVTQLDGFERAIGNFASWCAERQCALGKSRDQVLGAIRDLLTRLDAQPISVGERELTQSLAMVGIIFPLYGQQNSWDALRQGLVAAVQHGDGGILLHLADAYLGRSEDGRYDQDISANPAIRCLDSQKVSVSKELKEDAKKVKRAPTFGKFWGSDLICPLWPVAPAPKRPKITARGAEPILVIGTTGDPATPVEYAVSMARQLDSGVLITFRGYGHIAYSQSACVQRIVQDYLINNAVPRNGTTC
jgi:pimeloyl-ACP methyl ester carboxylesterase